MKRTLVTIVAIVLLALVLIAVSRSGAGNFRSRSALYVTMQKCIEDAQGLREYAYKLGHWGLAEPPTAYEEATMELAYVLFRARVEGE